MIAKDTKVLIFQKTPGCTFNCVLERTYPVITQNILKDGANVKVIVGYYQKNGDPFYRHDRLNDGTHVIDYQPGTGTGDFYFKEDFIIADHYELPDELFEI